nr:uncharacterized protein LOC129050506 isoform X1 [Pongo abelii]
MSCLSGNEGTPVAPEIGGGCLHWPLRKHSVCRNEGSRSGREKSTAIPLLSGAESGDVKATVAVLSFILSSASKRSVDGESLSSELQQLGLPKGMGCGWAAGQPVGQGLLEKGTGPVTLRCTLPYLGQKPKPSPHLLPPELLHSTPRARGQPMPLL